MTPSSWINNFMRACCIQFDSSHGLPSTSPVFKSIFPSWECKRSQHFTDSGNNACRVEVCKFCELAVDIAEANNMVNNTALSVFFAFGKCGMVPEIIDVIFGVNLLNRIIYF